MKRYLFFIVCTFCSLITFSQTIGFSEKRIKPANNIIKLSYGPGVLLSTFFDYGETYNNATMLELSLDYEHVWNNGFGFGINALQNHCSKGNFNVFYIGPSFVYNYTTNKGIRLDTTCGIGYAANDFDYRKSRNGVGVFVSFSLDYMFTKHFGFGIEARDMITSYKKPKEFKNYKGRYAIDWASVSLGVRYYF